MKRILATASLTCAAALMIHTASAQTPAPAPTLNISQPLALRIYTFLKADGGITSSSLADLMEATQTTTNLTAAVGDLNAKLTKSGDELKTALEKAATGTAPAATAGAPATPTPTK